MTVSELIEKLKEMPPDSSIYLFGAQSIMSTDPIRDDIFLNKLKSIFSLDDGSGKKKMIFFMFSPQGLE